MIKIGKKMISIPMILFMYLLIYNPPILSQLFTSNSAWLVMIPSGVYLLLNWKELKAFVKLRTVIWTEVFLGVVFAYLLVLSKLNGNPFSQHGFFAYWMAADIPFALVCWVALRKRGLGVSELLDHILWTGLLMAATVIAAFLIPAVKEFFTEKTIAYGSSKMIAVKLSAYRNFGLAANLTSTAAYVQAILACVAFWRGVRGKHLWLIAFPVLAFSANINARVSVYLLAAGMAAVGIALLFTKDWKRILAYIGITLGFAAAAYFGLGLVRFVNPMTHEWLTRGLEQVSTFVAGEETGYSDGYFGEIAWMLSPDHFPKGLKLIFGAGTEIIGGVVEEKYGTASDIGFMNDLWRGGLVYCVAMYGTYLLTLWRMMRSKAVRRETGIFWAVLWLFVFGIVNFKGMFLIHSDLTVVFILLAAGLVWGRYDSGDPVPDVRESFKPLPGIQKE